MNYKRNPYELNLVFLGGFNPFIFHPEWFRKIGLFSDQEIDASYEGGIWQDKDGNNNIINFTQFISPGISTIKISDIDIRVEPKRFQILTLDETKFDAAIASDFEALRNVFAFSFTSNSSELGVFKHSNKLNLTNFVLDIDNTQSKEFQVAIRDSTTNEILFYADLNESDSTIKAAQELHLRTLHSFIRVTAQTL